jgi:hypothetical protein
MAADHVPANTVDRTAQAAVDSALLTSRLVRHVKWACLRQGITDAALGKLPGHLVEPGALATFDACERFTGA